MKHAKARKGARSKPTRKEVIRHIMEGRQLVREANAILRTFETARRPTPVPTARAKVRS